MNVRFASLLLPSVLCLACGGGGGSDDDFGLPPATTGPLTGGMVETSTGDAATSGSTGADESGDAPGDSGDETGGPPPGGPQARGTIVIGEMHDPGGANATPIVNASFIPNDETAPASCATDVGGCSVVVPPSCATPCAIGEVCQYDDSCTASCIAPCNLACPSGEVCYFPVPGLPACREAETFEAGRLDFVGTKEPITLFPPYALPPGYEGTLTNPDSTVTVTASGASDAGFGPFEAMVTTSESLFTTIDEILPTESFGLADLTVTWVPGTDDIAISVVVSDSLGSSGTVTCEADDTTGTFAIPRTALDAAVSETATATSMFLTVARRHTESSGGHATVGSLIEEDLPAEGTVDFTFTSSESVTLLP